MSETKIQPIQNDSTLNDELLNLPQENASISPSSQALSNFKYDQQGVYDQVNQFFGEQDKQQKTVEEAREVLGDSASSITDEQVYDLVNEVQYLVDTWIEEFEREVFDGKTLKEVLQIDI